MAWSITTPVGVCACPSCAHVGPEAESTRGGPVSLGVSIAELMALLEARRQEGQA
ncbi:hypothetical protein [Nocardioides sp. REDSEA-S30_B4]|jgi:hypothetical protein|uniref:hypothetical protein n=1 Tax=Nocardioides sp. REDSEA-S30_B4 TaxID=1811552 RepID=UPI000AFD5F84|nr:hypothetical protein [Nocardioides sp. REDSEA-S30_B4]